MEETIDSLRAGMEDAYWVSASPAMVSPYNSTLVTKEIDGSEMEAATKHMVASRSKGKIVFVSSILGYMSIVGYSPYSPAKWALRGN